MLKLFKYNECLKRNYILQKNMKTNVNETYLNIFLSKM